MTMTLETMLAWCNEFLETAPDARNVESMRDGIRAAILDRDADRFTASNQTLRAERAEAELAAALKANRDCVDHFEQMQAELVALRARIEAAPLTTFRRAMLGTPHAWVEEKFACPEWIGKRVRLVVEE